MAHIVPEDLEESDLKYNLETMKKNATYSSVPTFDKLSTIDKHIETGMAMELSLGNKFTLGADESASMLGMSELSIFRKYVISITNTLCERFLCLFPLKISKSASALHKAIIKVFIDHNLNIKNIFFNAFDGTNTMPNNTDGLQRYMHFESPFSKYINFRSHRFVFVFVHLTRKFEVLGELDTLVAVEKN